MSKEFTKELKQRSKDFSGNDKDMLMSIARSAEDMQYSSIKSMLTKVDTLIRDEVADAAKKVFGKTKASKMLGITYNESKLTQDPKVLLEEAKDAFKKGDPVLINRKAKKFSSKVGEVGVISGHSKGSYVVTFDDGSEDFFSKSALEKV